MGTVSLSRQIAELKAERNMRDRVFPGLVNKGQMKAAAAAYRNESLEAAIATLEWLLRNEALVRRVHEETKAQEGGA